MVGREAPVATRSFPLSLMLPTSNATSSCKERHPRSARVKDLSSMPSSAGQPPTVKTAVVAHTETKLPSIGRGNNKNQYNAVPAAPSGMCNDAAMLMRRNIQQWSSSRSARSPLKTEVSPVLYVSRDTAIDQLKLSLKKLSQQLCHSYFKYDKMVGDAQADSNYSVEPIANESSPSTLFNRDHYLLQVSLYRTRHLPDEDTKELEQLSSSLSLPLAQERVWSFSCSSISDKTDNDCTDEGSSIETGNPNAQDISTNPASLTAANTFATNKGYDYKISCASSLSWKADDDTLLDIDDVKRKALLTYHRAAQIYKSRIAELTQQVEELRQREASMSEGGSKYALMQQQLIEEVGVRRCLQSRTKALVKLVERAGGQIRRLEDRIESMNCLELEIAEPGAQKREWQREDSSGSTSLERHLHSSNRQWSMSRHRSFAAGGTSLIDWSIAQAVVPDLSVNGRRHIDVLDDVVSHIERITSDCKQLQKERDELATVLNTTEVNLDRLKVQHHELNQNFTKEMEAVVRAHQEIESLKYALNVQRASAEEQKRNFDRERVKLVQNQQTAEIAVRKAVENKAHFIGLGRALQVPPFLRYDGKVKNLSLMKADLENIINSVWMERDAVNKVIRKVKRRLGIYFKNTVQRMANANQTHRKLQAEGGAVLEDPRGDLSNISVLQTAFSVSSYLPNTDNVAVLQSYDLSEGDGIDDLEDIGEDSYVGDTQGGGGGALLLVDYDNLNLLKTLPGTFAEHLTIYLVKNYDSIIKQINYEGYRSAAAPTSPPVSPVGSPTRDSMRSGGLFAVGPGVAELAYSIMDGCEKFKFDADIELFRRVAKGEVSELAYFDQMIMLAKLKMLLLDISQEGRLRAAVLIQALEKFFLYKSSEDLDLLLAALLADIGGSGYDVAENSLLQDADSILKRKNERISSEVVNRLFSSNEHGNQGTFVEMLRDQHLDDICTYSAEVSSEIAACVHLVDSYVANESQEPEVNVKSEDGNAPLIRFDPIVKSHSADEVPLSLIRRQLRTIDPRKPVEDWNAFLSQVLRLYKAAEKQGHSNYGLLGVMDPNDMVSLVTTSMSVSTASSSIHRMMSNILRVTNAEVNDTAAVNDTSATDHGVDKNAAEREAQLKAAAFTSSTTLNLRELVHAEKFAAASKYVFCKRYAARDAVVDSDADEE